MMAGKIVYIMGKGSSGKDTIYGKLLEILDDCVTPIVMYTTRPIRPGEVDRVTYHYVNFDMMKAIRGAKRIIEERMYETVQGSWIYATVDDGSIDLNENSYIGIGTLVSLEEMRNRYGHENIIPIYLEASDDIRIQRAVAREVAGKKDYTEMCRRWVADEKDFSEENITKASVIRVNNDRSIEAVVMQLIKIILHKI